MKRYNRTQFIFVQVLCACLLLTYYLSIKFIPISARAFGLLAIEAINATITIIAIIKRLHDIGYSGYWVIAITILSIVGKSFTDMINMCIDTGIVLIFVLFPGEKIVNIYGPPSEKRWSLW